MQKVTHYISSGWPRSKKNVPEDAADFWHIRDELYTADGIIFAGERIVIAEKLRSQMLALLHESHFGIEKKFKSSTNYVLTSYDERFRGKDIKSFNLF